MKSLDEKLASNEFKELAAKNLRTRHFASIEELWAEFFAHNEGFFNDEEKTEISKGVAASNLAGLRELLADYVALVAQLGEKLSSEEFRANAYDAQLYGSSPEEYWQNYFAKHPGYFSKEQENFLISHALAAQTKAMQMGLNR